MGMILDIHASAMGGGVVHLGRMNILRTEGGIGQRNMYSIRMQTAPFELIGRPAQEFDFQVEHEYNDGVWVLARKAIEKMEELSNA